ncbi:MAG: hypothetical protein LR015_01090 [Verrucomicrobia bacterium]|nr:hypothetical protein [Verrucomicrobiota bacterium]
MPKKTNDLSFLDIVLNADAETIQQALEARRRIDSLLAEREQAYKAIAALEEEIESVVGESGVFPFPEPPLPVAGYNSNGPANRKKVPGKETSCTQSYQAR